jgi:hypothetical protein
MYFEPIGAYRGKIAREIEKILNSDGRQVTVIEWQEPRAIAQS